MFRCRLAIVIGKTLKISRGGADLTQEELGVLTAFDVPEAYFYAVDDELAGLILQYHRFKKSNPGRTLPFSPNP